MHALSWGRLTPAAALAAMGLAALALAGCNTMSGAGSQVQQTACADFAFPVYFQSESDQLTPEATQLIAQSATRVKSCSVVGVSITGLEATNADLAARRVAAVDKALLANGIAAQAAVIQAPPAHGLTLLHRRIEVDVRLAPPKS